MLLSYHKSIFVWCCFPRSLLYFKTRIMLNYPQLTLLQWQHHFVNVVVLLWISLSLSFLIFVLPKSVTYIRASNFTWENIRITFKKRLKDKWECPFRNFKLKYPKFLGVSIRRFWEKSSFVCQIEACIGMENMKIIERNNCFSIR